LENLGAKTYNQIEHILIDRKRHESVISALLFRTKNCDNDHYLAVAKFKERLPVKKSQRFLKERLNLKKLIQEECEEKHNVEVSNSLAASQNLDDEL
jgi:hypothetical protein